jgi:hypothetical protein
MTSKPFKLSVTDEQLAQVERQCKEALERLPVFEANCLELDTAEDDFSFGLPPKTLRRLLQHVVSGYDWRKQEAAINAMGEHALLTVDDSVEGRIEVHYIHARSSHPDAKPLLLAHGWP